MTKKVCKQKVFFVKTINLNWKMLNWEVLVIFRRWDGIKDLILWGFKRFKRFKMEIRFIFKRF